MGIVKKNLNIKITPVVGLKVYKPSRTTGVDGNIVPNLTVTSPE